MPKTRRQEAAKQARQVLIIPPKNDISLFQKRSNSIEGLPLAIFLMIRLFLFESEYRLLMNCNLSTFQPIKYETVRYTLKGPERWKFIDSVIEERKESFFLNILNNNVQNKSKQITISLKNISYEMFQRFSYLYQGICKIIVEVERDSFPSSIDGNLLNNIRHVYLKSIKGIQRIVGGLENVVSLKCEGLLDLRSIQTNSSTMKELTVIARNGWNYHQNNSIELPSQNIPKITLRMPLLTSIQSLGKCEELIIEGSAFNTPFSQETFERIKRMALDLKYLKLSCLLPPQCNDFSLLQNIPKLEIILHTTSTYQYNNHLTSFFPSSTIPQQFSFPIFYGKSLSLTRFDLSQWDLRRQSDPTVCKNLRTLHLTLCSGFIDFPMMPGLVSLSLTSCYEIQSIPSLPQLQTLKMSSCDRLMTISPIQNHLKRIELTRCSSLKDLSFISEITTLQYLLIDDCKEIKNISMLGKVPQLLIKSCNNVTSLQGLNGISLQDDKRKIRLINLPGIKDYSSLHDIDYLSLVNMPDINDCTGIHSINHLLIKECSSVISTRGLQDIRCSLTFHTCNHLKELMNVEDIPVMNLLCCRSLIDYSGLKNHLTVTLRQSRYVYRRSGEASVGTWKKNMKVLQKERNIETMIFENWNGEQTQISFLESQK